ncbi:DUF2505 domain-containing protein [Citricoccus muralis]|uniref:DUF2505 domain-containing protein n=1 Tax=Citricoccus muralis TaxID=169134 RepID=A0ABY8H9E1_9MICC|nr:DUF2505 domain-containing protein [Citricoccus muralis]WFP17444.1 DUF2505 domain-containing protein [Citricoccus muralis]
MAFTESTELPFPVEEVFAVLTDEAFNRSVSESLGGELTEFSATPQGGDGATLVSMTRTVPAAKLPEMAKRFVKGQISVQQQDQWSTASAEGARTASMTVTVPAGKVTADVTQVLEPTEKGTRITVSGSVTCGIPFAGAKIAQFAEPQVGRVVNRQAREVKAWIQSR